MRSYGDLLRGAVGFLLMVIAVFHAASDPLDMLTFLIHAVVFHDGSPFSS